MRTNFLKFRSGNFTRTLLTFLLLVFISNFTWSQTVPYTFANKSTFADNDVYVAVVGIIGGHVWVDCKNSSIHQMSVSDNTVTGPIVGGNTGPGLNAKYANCFTRLSDIPNKTVNVPLIAGCRILISFKSQLFMYFFGYSGAPSGYAAPNLANPTDPNQGIRFEMIELTYATNGLWTNTTRVDSYQYPMGLEVWGNNSFYKKVGELKTHDQIIAQFKSSAPSEFQVCLDQTNGIIKFPTKNSTFSTTYLDSYINSIWSKYSSADLVFNSGDAGVWKGRVSGSAFVFNRASDGQVATIPRKPTTTEAMEGSGALATGAQWDLVVQAQVCAAINRHALDLNVASGVTQTWSDDTKYYQTSPYNYYCKFWHQADISFNQLTYAFCYDDVFDKSSTINAPSPTRATVTIGGFSGGSGCTSSTITPYLQVNGGAWQNTSSASLAAGGSVTMGPQPTDGTWKWTGPNGFSSTSREITISNIQSNQGGNYVGTYTNTGGCTSAITFNISVTGGCTASTITPYLQVNGGAWQNTSNTSLAVGGSILFGPQPTDGTWKWTGPNNYTSSSREISISNIQSNQGGNYIATYTNTSGCNSSATFAITVQSTNTLITKIEAENYSSMNGVQTEACSEGTLDVAYIDAGDWMAYNSVTIPTTGTYTIQYRVASLSGATLSSDLNGGTIPFGNVTIPATGGWQTWTTVNQTVTINAGTYSFGIYAQTAGWNINWISIYQGTVKSASADEQAVNSGITEIKLYPNPVSEDLFINIENGTSINFVITNTQGQVVMKSKISGDNAKVDLTSLKSGVYFIKINDSDIKKIIKQ